MIQLPIEYVRDETCVRTSPTDAIYTFDCLDIDVEFLARGLVTPSVQRTARRLIRLKAVFSRNDSDSAEAYADELQFYGLDVD